MLRRSFTPSRSEDAVGPPYCLSFTQPQCSTTWISEGPFQVSRFRQRTHAPAPVSGHTASSQLSITGRRRFLSRFAFSPRLSFPTRFSC